MAKIAARVREKLLRIFISLRDSQFTRDAVTTTVWGTVGKGAGFLVPFFIAAWFGVSSQTDAFFFSYSIILFFSGFFAPVIESAIVPFIVEIRGKNGDAGRFVGRIVCLSGAAVFVLWLLLLLCIKPFLSYVTRFSPDNLLLIDRLLLETSPLLVLLVWTSILTGVMNSAKVFFIPAVAPVLRAVVNIGFIFLLKERMGVHAVAWGYVAGEFARLVFLITAIARQKLFQIRLSFRINEELISFFKVALYQVVSMGAVGFNPVIDRTMASWLGGGSVSLLEYASRLYMIPVVFVTSGFLVVALSHWSHVYHMRGGAELKKDMNRSVKIGAVISVAITIAAIILEKPIVQLAFARGAFSYDKLKEVGDIFRCYMYGFLPYVISQIYVRNFIILRNTKALMHCALYKLVLNVALNYVLMKYIGVSGIALSTTLLSVFTVIYLARNSRGTQLNYA